MKYIIIVSSLFAYAAVAAEYEQFYVVNGKKVSAEEAVLASVKGSQAYKCTAVEAKVSKAGTSIGLRQIPRPKASK